MNPALLGLVAALSWGCLDLVASIASRRLGVFSTVLGIALGGLIALSMYLAVSGEGFPALAGPGAGAAYLAGALVALASLFLFAAFAAGPISVVSPIASSYPLTVLLIAFLIGNTPSAWAIAAAGVVIAGVVVVARAEPEDSRFDGSLRRCITLAAFSHVSWALAIHVGQVATAAGEGGGHAAAVTWLGRLASSAVIVLLLLLARKRPAIPARWLPAFAFVGGLDIAGILAVNLAAHSEDPAVAGVVASCFGVVTILLARVILKERIAPLRWAGIAITFAGVAALVALSQGEQP
jgi:drug/metabolite transporter (DMT)-like permease